MNDSIYSKLKSSEKITFTLEKFLNKFKLKDYDFSEGSKIAEIPISKSEENYNKISKFVMEYPQKFVENNKSIDGFIIIIDEFQLLKKLKNPDDFFWMIREYNQFQSNVSYVLSGLVSSTSNVIEMINGANGAFGGRMIQIDIEPFTKKETENYFKDRFSEIQFKEEGFDRLFEYTK